jgi:predicted ferric reductase
MSSAATRPRTSGTSTSSAGKSSSAKKRPAPAPKKGAANVATPTGKPKVPTVALWLAGLGLGLVVGIQLATRSGLSGDGAILIEMSRWAALLGTYGSLLVIFLIARVPIIERGVGHDRMVSWHRKLGPIALILIALHVALIIAGYAASEAVGYLAESWSLLSTYRWILPATAGFILMMMAGIASWRVARRRMSYETWWVTHLYLYLAIALAYIHAITLGQAFVTHAWARWIWIALYVITFGALIIYRIIKPIAMSLRHDLKVHSVERESADTYSIWISGKNVTDIGARGGQFFGWRFMTPNHWWQSHPYSLSAGPDKKYLRITVKDLGDHSRSLADLKPGTRVVAEGPYGIFTADARSGNHVVLVAGGVGITPVRALLDDLPKNVRVDLLYRAPKPEALVLHDELDAIARSRPNTRVRYLVGNRRSYPINAKSMTHLIPDFHTADVYTCGPAELVASVRHAAEVVGIPEQRIHDEAFSFHSPDTYGTTKTKSRTTTQEKKSR